MNYLSCHKNLELKRKGLKSEVPFLNKISDIFYKLPIKSCFQNANMYLFTKQFALLGGRMLVCIYALAALNAGAFKEVTEKMG